MEIALIGILIFCAFILGIMIVKVLPLIGIILFLMIIIFLTSFYFYLKLKGE
jgi:hypothetical protein